MTHQTKSSPKVHASKNQQKWTQSSYLEPGPILQLSGVDGIFGLTKFNAEVLFKESTLVHGVEQENDLSTNDSCPIKPGKRVLVMISDEGGQAYPHVMWQTLATCFSIGKRLKTFNIPKALHIGIFGLEIFQRHRWTSKWHQISIHQSWQTIQNCIHSPCLILSPFLFPSCL